MEWKIEWLGKVIELCNEYQQLDGLQDSFRAIQIPEEILDIVEKELNK